MADRDPDSVQAFCPAILGFCLVVMRWIAELPDMTTFQAESKRKPYPPPPSKIKIFCIQEEAFSLVGFCTYLIGQNSNIRPPPATWDTGTLRVLFSILWKAVTLELDYPGLN